MSGGSRIISVDGVGKRYDVYDRPHHRLLRTVLGSNRKFHREFWALRDVSLTIHAGEAWGLVGRNGSGKSTLLQIIAGTLEPSTGSVVANGRISALLELGSGFNPEFSGRENIYLNGAILGINRAAIDERLDEILGFADIGAFIDQPLRTYSSGMIMRLAFAVAVCVEPEILIVDEALAVGDAGFQFKCLSRIKRMMDNGMTLLFVSHDLAMVKTFCQHAVYLREGRVEFIGAPDKVGEIYLRDLRSEQRQASDAPSVQIHAKPSLSGAQGIAFGTQLGDIEHIGFGTGDLREDVVSFGDPVEIRLSVRYQPDVQHPCVALAILDQRHVVVAGKYSYLSCCSVGQETRVELVFSFGARFAEGRYFVTAVLEDRVSEAQALLVDKQSAVMSFQVLPASGEELLGIFDIGMQVGVTVLSGDVSGVL